MKELNHSERIARYIIGFIMLVIVYLILLPCIIVAVLANYIGQVFDNISKTLTPDFTYLNDNIFAIQNGCTKKEFDAEMRQLREQIASEQEMKGKTEKNELCFTLGNKHTKLLVLYLKVLPPTRTATPAIRHMKATRATTKKVVSGSPSTILLVTAGWRSSRQGRRRLVG